MKEKPFLTRQSMPKNPKSDREKISTNQGNFLVESSVESRHPDYRDQDVAWNCGKAILHRLMEQIVSTLYGISGITASALYIPQILKYRRDLEACKSISLLCWIGWAALAAITVLYAVCVVRSHLFATIAALNLGAQLVVIFYGVRARRSGKTEPVNQDAALDRAATYQKG